MIFDAIAVDDDPCAIDDLMDTIEPITNLNVVGKFHSVDEALSFLRTKRRVNFIFSDIVMPGISGIEALGIFPDYCDFLVYVTGHVKYHSELINGRSVGYLMKPLKVEKVIELIQHLTKIKEHDNIGRIPQFLKVKKLNNYTALTISVRDILCITTCGNYVEVYTATKTFSHYAPLIEMESLLCRNEAFLSISQSCIVAKSAIVHVEGDIVRLSNGAEYKISRSRKAVLSIYL